MRVITILILAAFCASLRADTVILKDGTRVEGDVKRGEGGYDVKTADGKSTHVSSGDIQSIQLGKATGGGSSLDKLASLKRSVESLDDLNVIISRYNSFIQLNKGTPAAEQAQTELAGWQEKFDKQMVKIAGKWVTPEEHEQLITQSGDIIRNAYDLMKANKLKEAEPVLKQALEIDPSNPVANYLQGVLLFRGEKLVPARKAFELAHAQVPSDAATLNNLAVIAWRQNQFINSLGFYSDAMLAMPANKEIVNNAAEALAALKVDFKKHPVAQRTSRLFIEQEAQLEATMAQYGWYRWGSAWLDQNQLNALKKAEKEVKDHLDTLQKQFDEQQKRISDNDAQIAKDQQLINDLRMSTTVQDSVTGQIYTMPQPQAYRDAQAEVQTLTNENVRISHDLDSMREQAKKLEASKPKPTFKGVQNLIGVEGAPKIGVLAEEAAPAITPASQPSTAPTTQPRLAPPPIPAPAAPGNPPGIPVANPPANPTTNRVF